MTPIRGLWRIARALVHGAAGVMIILTRFGSMPQAARNARVERWAQDMLRILRIELVVHGARPNGPVLIVANHVSWLDIVVMHATRHCRFVAKSEIRQWPLIGRLSTAAGSLYIERSSRRDASRVVDVMAESLREGDVLAVFPEGTTSDGSGLLPFHSNLLQSAVVAGVDVQPLALKFVDATTGKLSLAPAYVGDLTLAQSVWKTVTAPPLMAVIRFGEIENAVGKNRRELSADMERKILRMLSEP